jgi:hypothetical protein
MPRLSGPSDEYVAPHPRGADAPVVGRVTTMIHRQLRAFLSAQRPTT